MKNPRWNNITSHFEECGVNELVIHHLLSLFSALFGRLHASSTVDPIQYTVVSSNQAEVYVFIKKGNFVNLLSI